MQQNPALSHLIDSYLFPEIERRKQEFLQEKPSSRIISLAIGDAKQPIPRPVVNAMAFFGQGLGTEAGFMGYGPSLGRNELRKKIAERLYRGKVAPSEISISDGAKPDLARLQYLFSPDARIALQDPTYPVYLDASILAGRQEIVRLPCLPENGFFPEKDLPPVEIIYLCSPNNPTGSVMTHAQLRRALDWAREVGAIILFDSAYAGYIRDPNLPKSIYEIEGARERAIEIGSFSKLAGFSGVRLGWTIVPEELTFREGGSVQEAWKRICQTLFNGASTISQAGGLAALEDAGWERIQPQIDFVLENACILRGPLEEGGLDCYGGTHAPYLWTHFPSRNSWELFDYLLKEAALLTIPGSGFGPSGESFIRFSAFGQREEITEAAERLRKLLQG